MENSYIAIRQNIQFLTLVITYSDEYQIVDVNNVYEQFTRSSTANGLNPVQENTFPLQEDTLKFESRFESGNLCKVFRIAGNFYELHLRPDLYTSRHLQWFYFSVQNMKAKTTYRYAEPARVYIV